MKTEYPKVCLWELALVFVLWILFNLGLGEAILLHSTVDAFKYIFF